MQLYFWIKRNKKLIVSIANGSTFKEIYKKDFEKLSINVQDESRKMFTQETEKLFHLYESLVLENNLICELKEKLLLTKF